ncbi:hypothetical protein NG799_25215 [Laspinema sp. D1]|uniref:Uncharacterized protein n=1 Tax=Laspinema palackyanum D2a TaxID=2953684 RepID=A0ABT2MYK9_9CYAN|nr:hypothetical protein [Laspinema sp. D2b]MCT7969617.1 hypothetical protein [Laspinema sp. D2a]
MRLIWWQGRRSHPAQKTHRIKPSLTGRTSPALPQVGGNFYENKLNSQSRVMQLWRQIAIDSSGCRE